MIWESVDMKKISKKDKRRFLIWSLLIVIIISYLGVFSFHYWNQILTNQKEKKLLEDKYTSLLSEEENLKSQINKLQNPDYAAEYAREKYRLSKDGEVNIKLPEELDN